MKRLTLDSTGRWAGLCLILLFWAGCGDDPGGLITTAPPPPPPPPPPVAPPGQAPQQAPPSSAPRPVADVAGSNDAQDARNLFTVGASRPNFTVQIAALPAGLEQALVTRPVVPFAPNSFRVVPPPSKPQPAIDPAFRLPGGFSPLFEHGVSTDGRPLRIRCDKDEAVMAYVPAGAFLQGIDGADPQAGPAHPVYVDAFYMDVYETTLGQYREFRLAEAAKRPAPPLNEHATAGHPATGVSWRDANNYVQWAGKDLPTEAEWEKAARGERNFTYPWGEERPLWPRPRKPGQIDPVGSYRTDCNAYGLFDLAGNVREWCGDWYGDTYYATLRMPDGSPFRNPTGPTKASQPNARVLKGPGAAGWELWRRSGVSMRETLPDVGFRGILRTPAAGAPARGA